MSAVSTNTVQATVPKWISMDGFVTEQNKSDIIRLNKMMKPHRVKSFQVAVDFLQKIGVSYFASDGTLLAIYREQGKIISHDLDTDMAILEEDMHTVWRNRHLLPDGYRWQTTCPATGVEWCDENGCKPFDPATKGAKKFQIFDKADYSPYLKHFTSNPTITEEHVSVYTDIYTYRRASDDPAILQNNYALRDTGEHKKRYPYDWIFPLKKYLFEGVECYGPNNPKLWLTEYYGYIGLDAYYDPEVNEWKKME